MKTTENRNKRKTDGFDLNRYPIASDTYQLADDLTAYYQECLVIVNERWLMESYYENSVYITELQLDEVLAWLDSSRDNARFKRSVFANKYFNVFWEVL